MSGINISKNPTQNCRKKHIDIYHHFIKEFLENKTIILEHVEIIIIKKKKQLADIFTKALDYVTFDSLKRALEIFSM